MIIIWQTPKFRIPNSQPSNLPSRNPSPTQRLHCGFCLISINSNFEIHKGNIHGVYKQPVCIYPSSKIKHNTSWKKLESDNFQMTWSYYILDFFSFTVMAKFSHGRIRDSTISNWLSSMEYERTVNCSYIKLLDLLDFWKNCHSL